MNETSQMLNLLRAQLQEQNALIAAQSACIVEQLVTICKLQEERLQALSRDAVEVTPQDADILPEVWLISETFRLMIISLVRSRWFIADR